MDIQDELKLSYYKELSALNKNHKVSIVQHINDNKIYVKKILDVFNYDVYIELKDSPVKGMPRLYEVIQDGDTLVIIEEYISGYSLEQLLQSKGPIVEKKVIDYSIQLCNILAELHSRQPAIIHRDIKPSNIIITPMDKLILIDLNAAKYESNKEKDTQLLGTKGYAAPEQYGFGSSNAQTDIYAVGILMNTMLGGEYSATITTSGKLKKIVAKCTELSPKYRYKSVEDLLKALKSLHVIGNKIFPRAWMSYLPPGFRSGNPGYMLVAAFVYYLILYISFNLTFENADKVSLIYVRTCILFSSLFIVLFSCNYLDVQSQFTIFKSEKKILRFINIIIVDMLILVLAMAIIQIGSYIL